MSRLAQAGFLPSGMRLRGNRPRRTVLASHFLDECETHPEHMRQSTLRAEPAFLRFEEFLT